MLTKRLFLISFGFMALFSNWAAAQTVKPAETALYPPLVTEIPRLFPSQFEANSTTAAALPAKPGATSGAGGFPAQPAVGISSTGGTLTTIGVLAIVGGLLIMLSPDGSTGNSSASSTN